MTAPLGAVLCGGASRRMGVDKATVRVDGVAMARRVADALLAAGCTPVIAIGGDAEALRALGLDRVDDDFPGEGPLGGVLTALSIGAPAAVLACDLPMIRAATVSELVAALGSHDASMAVSGRPEPLCAVWSSTAGALLRAQFSSGERAMHRAIESLDIAWVDVPAHDLRNVNTPDDLRSL